MCLFASLSIEYTRILTNNLTIFTQFPKTFLTTLLVVVAPLLFFLALAGWPVFVVCSGSNLTATAFVWPLWVIPLLLPITAVVTQF